MEKQAKRIGAAYIRVSTNDQMELSPESQLKEIIKFAGDHDIMVPEEFIFMEKAGRSGKRAGNRPEFQRMIATAKMVPRPFAVILVWKFSRFARNQDESTFYKGMLRKKLGIDILSVSEPVLDGMYGRLIELIIEWQDEFYSYNLSAEVRRGMEQKALGGGYQSALPLGYRSPGPGKIPVIVKEQAEIVKTIFSLCVDEGKTPSQIAAFLNENKFKTKRGKNFEGRSAEYILKNPFYTGRVRWNRAPHGSRRENPAEEIFIAAGRHEAIISEELFNRAGRELMRLELQKKQGISTSHSPGHYLSGLLKCPFCGRGLAYNSSQSPNFQCPGYAKGLHKGSASISEKKAVSALFRSLEEKGFSRIISGIQEPAISVSKKRDLLRSVLNNIIYDKKNGSFCFCYRL